MAGTLYKQNEILHEMKKKCILFPGFMECRCIGVFGNSFKYTDSDSKGI